jgi:hypothetical protein
MTENEKAKKFEQIQTQLWEMALRGNLLQSSFAAALIRELSIDGPDGQEPDEA